MEVYALAKVTCKNQIQTDTNTMASSLKLRYVLTKYLAYVCLTGCHGIDTLFSQQAASYKCYKLIRNVQYQFVCVVLFIDHVSELFKLMPRAMRLLTLQTQQFGPGSEHDLIQFLQTISQNYEKSVSQPSLPVRIQYVVDGFTIGLLTVDVTNMS